MKLIKIAFSITLVFSLLLSCAFATPYKLKNGSVGDGVARLQTELIILGYLNNATALGYFGEETTQAVLSFQKDNGLKEDGIVGDNTHSIITSLVENIDINKIYGPGDSGHDVRLLQGMLAEKGYMGSISISGIYGHITQSAVERYQKDNGLKVDGIAGKNTLISLIGATVIDSIIQSCEKPDEEYLDKLYLTLDSSQRDEIYLLAQLITAESGNQPYIGQVAVGSVVMNRMEHDKQTMREVIFRKNAFSVAKDGKINKIPTQQCTYAAIQAYFGAKPVSTARFFNVKSKTDSWAALNRTLYAIIGNHAFYI